MLTLMSGLYIILTISFCRIVELFQEARVEGQSQVIFGEGNDNTGFIRV